jgi:RNA polymerase sigma-70 factor, ECF subfamily
MGTWPGGWTFGWWRACWAPVSGLTDEPGGGGPDAQRWPDVVARYADVVYTMAYRLTGNDEEARDVAQDVLLRLHRGLGHYEEGNFEGWLYRTTVNVFRDRLRKTKRRREDVTAEPPHAVAPESVEQEVTRTELREVVQRAISSLPPDYREVIVLRDIEGRSYEEIAEILDIPSGTVRSRIHRGREALRSLLAPYVEAAP